MMLKQVNHLMWGLCFTLLAYGSAASAEGLQAAATEGLLINNFERAGYAANQLNRTQLASGFFPYDFDFSNGQSTDMDDISGLNLVRQADAIFSLATYLQHTRDPATEQTIIRFLQQASQQSVPIGKGSIQQLLESIRIYNRWQIWRPLRKPLYQAGLLFTADGDGKLVTVNQDYEQAYPGATALTLIAALQYRRVTGDHQFDTEISHWKDGLVALMVDGRGLREAPHYLTESPYVNGEAWLALAEYQAAFPSDAGTLSTLTGLEDYLFQRYQDQPEKKFYSWGMMALNVRFKTTGDSRYFDFAHSMTTWFFSENENHKHSGYNSCAVVEGVATFVNMMKLQLRSADNLTQTAESYIAREMAFNRQLQVGESPEKLLESEKNYQKEADKFRGSFILSRENPLMQVDLTAHCINALLLSTP